MLCIGKTLKFFRCNIPQSTGSSSDLSWQSGWVLHKKCGLVQFPSLHWNWPTGQYRCRQVGGSSEPSRQSFCPSHFHQIGIHLQRENSVFFVDAMSLQIYNHPFTTQKTVLSQCYFLKLPRHLEFLVFCFICQMLTKYARILSPETDDIGGPLEGSSQQINTDLIFMYICGNHLSCFLNQSSIRFLMR